MALLPSCEFNMDTVCVELKFADGSMISVDSAAVENGGARKLSALKSLCRNARRNLRMQQKSIMIPYIIFSWLEKISRNSSSISWNTQRETLRLERC